MLPLSPTHQAVQSSEPTPFRIQVQRYQVDMLPRSRGDSGPTPRQVEVQYTCIEWARFPWTRPRSALKRGTEIGNSVSLWRGWGCQFRNGI
jgi:hypothetical protein